MAKRKKKKTHSHRGNPIERGKVVAHDFTFTGQEPEWAAVTNMTDEEFLSRRIRVLSFYNYYLNHQYLMPDTLDWLKAHAYPKEEIKQIKENPMAITFTNKKLMRAMNMGMPGAHQSYMKDGVESDLDRIRGGVTLALAKAFIPADDELTEEPVKRISPMERAIAKTHRDIVSRLDNMLDDWIETPNDERVTAIALLPLLTANNVKGATLKVVKDWIEKQWTELDAAYHKTDDQMVEGYSHLPRSSLRNRMLEMKKLLNQCESRGVTAKVTRAPRAKKPITIGRQIANLRYQETDEETGLVSLAPTAIPGKRHILLYNTKYKIAIFMTSNSADGFSVSGTSINNTDKKNSFAIKLRKPKETMLELHKASMNVNTVKELLGKLTTKAGSCNGRMNDHTLIIKSW